MHPSSNPATTPQWAGALLLALISASATLHAQDPPTTPPPVTTEPATAPTAPTAPTPATPRVGQIQADTPARCWPTEHSPVYTDAFKVGDVVKILAEADGFFTIALAQGATGYVHKKFATGPDADGMVKATGTRVSFRYRPRSTEAPVSMLEANVALPCMGMDDEWFVVRNPSAVVYVPVAAVTVPEDQAALAAPLAAAEQARVAAWNNVTQARIAKAKADEELRVNRAALAELTARFRAEASKPWKEQQTTEFAALEAALTDLAPKFASDTSERVTAASLDAEIKKQVVVLEAQFVASEKLPPAPGEAVVRPVTPDPIERFDLVGWLKVVSSSVPSRAVRLMRGGKVLGYLTCTNERYDFAIFDGAEVGVIGPKEASNDGAWAIDVQRLEVLSVTLK